MALTGQLTANDRPLYKWYVLFVLVIAFAFASFDRLALGLFLPGIRASFGISDTQVSLLVGFAFATLYSIAGVPLAAIADSTNRKRLIILGSLVWTVMTAVCGLAPGFWTLFWGRVGVGVGEATLSPTCYSLLADYFPKRRLGLAIGIYMVGSAVGAGLSMVAAGVLIAYLKRPPPALAHLLGHMEVWRIVFLLVAGLGLWVPLSMLTIREPRRVESSGEAAQKAKGGEIREVFRFMAIRRGMLAPLFLGMSSLSLVIGAMNAWSPTLLMRNFHVPTSLAAAIFGLLFLLGTASGYLIGGVWTDRQASKGNSAYFGILGLASLISIPCAFFPLVSNIQLLVCLMVAWTIVCTVPAGVALAGLQLMTPNRLRAKMAALYFLCVNLLGLSVGPTAVALVTDYVFKNDARLPYSMTIVAGLGGTLAAIAFAIGGRFTREGRAAAAAPLEVRSA